MLKSFAVKRNIKKLIEPRKSLNNRKFSCYKTINSARVHFLKKPENTLLMRTQKLERRLDDIKRSSTKPRERIKRRLSIVANRPIPYHTRTNSIPQTTANCIKSTRTIKVEY